LEITRLGFREGSFAYSLRLGRILHLLIGMKVGVRSLLFSRRILTDIGPSLIANLLPEKNCQNFERKRDFGGFQLQEIREKKIKSH
jgi:hypothetical protein